MPRWVPVLCLLCLLTPAVVRGSSVLVDPANPSAYARINDALAAVRASAGAIESVYVAAAAYPETLSLRYEEWGTIAVKGIAPRESIVVAGMTLASGSNFRNTLEGLTFTAHVGSTTFNSETPPVFRNCIFTNGATSFVVCRPPNFFDCLFRGNTVLYGYATQAFTGLRFEHCSLLFQALCGDVTLSGCQFAGCPDTALSVQGASDDIVHVNQCRFDSCGVAIAVSGAYQAAIVSACQFNDCGVGVLPHKGNAPTGSRAGSSMGMGNNRFTRVGCAVRATTPWRLSSTSDTVMTCGGPAFDAVVYDLGVGGLIVDGAESASVLHGVAPYTGVRLGGCEFRNGTAGGLVVEAGSLGSAGVVVQRCVFANNAGAGLTVAATAVNATHNLAFDNGGAGFAFTLEPTVVPDSIAYNTSASNQGDGLTVSAGPGGMPATLVVARNLAAMNAGDGIRLAAGFTGTFAVNDAWQNYGAAYSGIVPDPTNLELDPKFCGLATGDLTVSVGSPCAPNMSTGPIGALGVGCDLELLGVPPTAGVTAFHVRPSPARGSVEFAAAPLAVAGRIEVLDAQGRRVWGATLAPGAAVVRWRGELARGGHAGAGVYWVRLTRADGTQARRFAWLR